MGSVRPFTPVTLVVGVLSTRPYLHESLYLHLESEFGKIALVTDPVAFTFTTYYNEEMHGTPQRFFVVFENLIDPELLASFKGITNNLEARYHDDEGFRAINLDPGIISAENLILATTKNRSHRIPLRNGIYGEVTLLYRNHTFQPLPWTYADYASDDFIALFCKLRHDYLIKLKHFLYI